MGEALCEEGAGISSYLPHPHLFVCAHVHACTHTMLVKVRSQLSGNSSVLFHGVQRSNSVL